MTLPVGVRHEVCGTLVCRSAVHVGSGRESALADLAVVRDGLDRPLLPGTGLAGALRAYLGAAPPLPGEEPAPATNGSGTTVAPGTIEDLFGFVEERPPTSPDAASGRGGSRTGAGWSRQGAPALIRVDDALLVGPLLAPGTRDGVGIDRRTGAAAAGFLYEKEFLPAGTRFSFRLVADEPPRGDPRVWQAVERLVGALLAGAVPVGAGRTAGLGRIVLEDVTVRRADLSGPEGLVAWLTGGAVLDPAPSFGTPADPALTVTVHWEPVGPLLVKDSLEGTAVDALPLTARDAAGRVRLLLPGSSVKGVLRSHAERIVRTLRGQDAPGSLRRTLESERLPGVVGLFGAGPRNGTPTGPGEAPDPDPGRRGALEVEDCHSLGHVSAEDWDTVLAACPDGRDTGPPRGGPSPGRPAPGTAPAPGPDRRAGSGRPTPLTARPADRGSTVSVPAGRGVPAGGQRNGSSRQRRQEDTDALRKARTDLVETLGHLSGAAGPAVPSPAGDGTPTGQDDRYGLDLSVSDHVAIDRWTGGAAQGRLFSVLEPALATAWHPIRLRVDPRRAGGPEGDDATAVVLFLLVLRDLADGWLSLGFGRTRGRGHVAVREIEFSGAPGPAGGPWRALAGRTLSGLLADPPEEIRNAVRRWNGTVRPREDGTIPQEAQP